MALSIKSDTADRMARELAELTGESITDAVTGALSARLEAERRLRSHRRSALDLVAEFNRLPVLDARTPEEILGYDDLEFTNLIDEWYLRVHPDDLTLTTKAPRVC